MGCGVSVLFKEPLSLELSGDTNVLAFGEIPCYRNDSSVSCLGPCLLEHVATLTISSPF